jgi:lipid-A-disaccharide synthase
MESRAPRIFLSAGEVSGDTHGAALLRELGELRPDVEAFGYGGERMREAGLDLRFNLPDLAIMWIFHVVRRAPTLWKLIRDTGRLFDRERPDLVVLIDYPGLHLVLAGLARRRGIPVAWYIAPQLWAWAPWRARKIAARVDRVLSLFPFEVDFYRSRGVEAEHVGHPLCDHLAEVERTPPAPVVPPGGGPLVGILPGSRRQEIEHNLPMFLRAARRIGAAVPGVRFAIGCVSETYRDAMERMAREAWVDAPVLVDRTYDLMRTSRLCLAASGTTTLELAWFGTPMVIAYQCFALSYPLYLALNTAPFIALVNILAGRMVCPEYLWVRSPHEKIAQDAVRLLAEETRRSRMIAELQRVRGLLGSRGASRRAAEAVASLLPRPAAASSHR